MFHALLEDARQLSLEIIANPNDFTLCADKCDGWALIVAPEFDDHLGTLCQAAQTAGWKLLGCSPEAIELTSDKWQLFRHWQAHQVATPRTWQPNATPIEAGRYLHKHRFGAGSLELGRWSPSEKAAESCLVQEYCEGIAVSIAMLADAAGQLHPLWPAYQHLDENFQYQGGSLIQDEEHYRRTMEIGLRALRCVSGLLGYVGVDAVLSERGDFAIEINPRITTSYLGLRRATTANLLLNIIHAVDGKPINLDWQNTQIRWDASGTIYS